MTATDIAPRDIGPAVAPQTSRKIRHDVRAEPLLKVGGYIPALDGLRGLAILMVLCFHFFLGEGPIPGRLMGKVAFHIALLGWCGVDLFFVLSGFLITGILYEAKQSARSHSIYFRDFYMK